MRIQNVSQAEFAFPSGRVALAIPVFEDEAGTTSPLIEEADARAIARLREKGTVRGKPQEVLFLPSVSGAYDGVVLLGLGNRGACTAETVRRTAGKACESLGAHRIETVVCDAASIVAHAHGIAEGIMLGQYRFDQYKERKTDEPAPQAVEMVMLVVEQADTDLTLRYEQARTACESANWARDLANTPSNDMTPSRLAGEALEMAEDADLSLIHISEPTRPY